MRNRTWKVLEWSRESEWNGETVPLQCEGCGRDAECPVLDSIHASRPIAGGGMGVIFDTNPKAIGKACFPEVIECRKCHRAYSDWGSPAMEKEVKSVR